ncbi:hypothetical protein M2277_002478 [Paenibacillus sp. LBL]|jgi:hypothetical protein|nr:hypothetical protein [Paenibacillus sp. LBL]
MDIKVMCLKKVSGFSLQFSKGGDKIHHKIKQLHKFNPSGQGEIPYRR